MTRPSASMVTIARNHSHTCAPAMFTSRGYYSRWFISFRALDCAVIIRGRQLFEGGNYLRVASIRMNTVHMPGQQVQFSFLFYCRDCPLLVFEDGSPALDLQWLWEDGLFSGNTGSLYRIALFPGTRIIGGCAWYTLFVHAWSLLGNLHTICYTKHTLTKQSISVYLLITHTAELCSLWDTFWRF